MEATVNGPKDGDGGVPQRQTQLHYMATWAQTKEVNADVCAIFKMPIEREVKLNAKRENGKIIDRNDEGPHAYREGGRDLLDIRNNNKGSYPAADA